MASLNGLNPTIEIEALRPVLLLRKNDLLTKLNKD